MQSSTEYRQKLADNKAFATVLTLCENPVLHSTQRVDKRCTDKNRLVPLKNVRKKWMTLLVFIANLAGKFNHRYCKQNGLN